MPCALRLGLVWSVAVKPAYGWQNRAPMTYGKWHSVSRQSPCTFKPHQQSRHNVKKSTCANGTDWERVKREAAADAPIDDQSGPYDPNDTAAVAAFWKEATITRGRGRPPVSVKRPTLNMRVDAEVIDASKATWPGWQTRINAVLRDALAHGVTAFAAHTGISRMKLSRVLHGHAAVSADMDLRLSEALGTSPGYWLAPQIQRDLWTARQTAKVRKRINRMASPKFEAA